MSKTDKYDPDCETCNGTGHIYGTLYDPPEECDCWDRYDPSPVVDTDEQLRQEAEKAREHWCKHLPTCYRDEAGLGFRYGYIAGAQATEEIYKPKVMKERLGQDKLRAEVARLREALEAAKRARDACATDYGCSYLIWHDFTQALEEAGE